MKRIWYVLAVLVIIFLVSGCDTLRFRPVYPATFTPLPASPTSPLTTIAATLTPSPRPTQATSTPAPNGLNTAWFVNAVDRTLLNIDPASKTILHTVPIEGIPIGVAVGENSVWAIERISQESSNILKIDPFSRLVVTRIPIRVGEALSIYVGNGSVWLSVAGEFRINESPDGGVEFSRSGSVLRIDPITNQIAETIDMGAVAADIFMEDETLWVLSKKKSYSFVNKIDLTSRMIYTIPESIISADYIHRFDRFIKQGIWMWMTPQDINAQYLFRVSSLDGIVDSSVQLGSRSEDSPVQLIENGGKIWAALRSGDIAIVDPVLRKVEEKIETGASDLIGIKQMVGYIWAVSSGDAEVFQISPETREIITSYSIGSAPPPTPTPTTTSTPNPNLIWALCEEAFPTRLQVGMNAVVNDDPPLPNRVRVEPNTESLILGYVQPGERVEILSGPVCQDGWVWWNVISLETGLNGWTSEGDGTDYWLVPLD